MVDAVRAKLTLRAIDTDAEHEADAELDRMLGRERFLDPYPAGTLGRQMTDLINDVEDGKQPGSKLEELVASLKPEDKILFYSLRQQVLNVRRLENIDRNLIPENINWPDVMKQSIEEFKQIGLAMQDVEYAIDQEEQHTESLRPVARTETERAEYINPAIVLASPTINDHKQSDIGRFFQVDTTKFSGGLPAEVKLTKQRAPMLIRPTSYTLLDKVRRIGEADAYSLGDTVVVGGNSAGAGRSTNISYLVAWARQHPEEWLTLFVPDSERISQSGVRMVESRRHPGVYTQPDLQRDLFSELMTEQEALLKSIALKREYPSDSPVSQMTSLYELLEYACDPLKNEEGDSLFDVFEELRLVSEVKVLIAVDGFNELTHMNSAYWHPDTGKPLPARQLAIAKLLIDFFDKGPTNGVTVVAMSSKYHRDSTTDLRKVVRQVITCGDYTADEFTTVIEHWIKSGLVFQTPKNLTEFKNFLGAMSGRSPRELSRALMDI